MISVPGVDTPKSIRSTSDLIADAVHDPQAYAALYERFREFSKRFAYLHLRNHQDAEDVVQIAWIRVFTSLSQFRGDGKFSSWLGTIILNECREVWKRTSREHTTSFDGEFRGGNHLTSHLDTEAEHQRRDMRRKLHRQMQLVPRIYRTVLVMYYANHFSVTQIARKLRISESAAKSRLSRARMELAARVR
jgi:RNA polymerase sigma-70 factor (ECF subfamily)